MTADYELVEVSRLLGSETMEARSSRMSRSGERKEGKVLSTELSTLAWTMARRRCLVGVE